MLVIVFKDFLFLLPKYPLILLPSSAPLSGLVDTPLVSQQEGNIESLVKSMYEGCDDQLECV
uniref:Uncharacterized protein n=1 Tax=Helianthus annuus TaxID=4232 RepID=A0A251RU64_HELAN